jgi:integrase
VRTGFLEDGQFERIVSYCPELWFRGPVECGRTYGWRVSELLTMRARQVDICQRTIRLEPGTTKNHDGRTVTMTAAVFHLLGHFGGGNGPEDHVFTRSGGKPVLSFKKTWRNACEQAGISGLLFHDLRRTAARDLRRAGIPEGVIMKIGGWRTRFVFERYNIISHSDISEAMGKLERAGEHDRSVSNDHDFDHDSANFHIERGQARTPIVN